MNQAYDARTVEAERFIADDVPEYAIMAGVEAWERAKDDMTNYVSGETTDWDEGMIVAAIYKAVLAALPTSPGQTTGGASEPSPLSDDAAIFTICIQSGGNSTMHTRAGKKVEPFAALDAAMQVLKAEYDDARRCPAHAPGSAADGGSDAIGETVAKLREQLNDSSPRTGEDWPDYCHRVRPLMAQAAALLTALEQRQVGWPKLTDAMIRAAGVAHFGKRRFRESGGPDGVNITVNGRDWSFRQMMRRMWPALHRASAPLPTHPEES